MDQDEVLDKGYDAGLLRRLLVYLRPYRGLTALAVVLLLAGAGLALVGPALTQRALDVAIPLRDTGLLGTLALVFLGALVLEFLVEYGQTLLTTYLGQRVMYDLRMQIFGHLQRKNSEVASSCTMTVPPARFTTCQDCWDRGPSHRKSPPRSIPGCRPTWEGDRHRRSSRG